MIWKAADVRGRMRYEMKSALVLLLGCFCGLASLRAASWHSAALNADVPAELFQPVSSNSTGAPPLAVYLRNLASPRAGTEPDASIIQSLRADGFLVLSLDYQGHKQARVPGLNLDLARLREDLRARKLPTGARVDEAHCYILPSGHRIARDLVYYRDGARTLGMDLIYPSNPTNAVGTILEFSCDNAQRMGNFSLCFCSDTLLEGLATEGYAVAMADHPVAPAYKGRDPMPDCGRKIKAAVRLLRAETLKRGGNGRIAAAGFSRGSGMALMLATTGDLTTFDGFGEVPKGDSTIQGAVILSGRFTYLDLLPDDKMIPRYEGWWGDKAGHVDVWKTHGALDYLEKPAIPLFLSINIAESPDALHQMTVLRKRLADLGSDEIFMMDRNPRGHKVPLDPAILKAMNTYLASRLDAPESGAATSVQH